MTRTGRIPPHSFVRPLDVQGKRQCMAEAEYFRMRNGEERDFATAEFRAAQNEDEALNFKSQRF